MTVINIDKTSFLNKYKIINEIGSYNTGSVFEVENLEGTIKRIMKQVIKPSMMPSFLNEVITSELKLIELVDHVNIIQVYDYFDSFGSFYLVTEFLNGVGLNHYLRKHGKLTEETACNFAYQLASGLYNCHFTNIAHQTLSLQTIWVTEQDGLLILKIIDFGLALIMDELSTNVLERDYTYSGIDQKSSLKMDIWSLGVVIFEMITGNKPFEGKAMEEVAADIRSKDIREELANCKVSAECQNFIAGCLTVEIESRMSSKEVINHAWLRGEKDKKQQETVEEDLVNEMIYKLKNNYKPNALQESFLSLIVYKLPRSTEIQNLIKVYDMIEVKDELISLEELSEGFAKVLPKNKASKDAKDIFLKTEVDELEAINSQNFLLTAVDRKKLVKDERTLKLAFHYFDNDNSGTVYFDDLNQYIFSKANKNEKTSNLPNLVREFGLISDGQMDFCFFRDTLRRIFAK